MSATGFIRGREVVWDEDGDRYLWADTMEPAAGWGGDERPCPLCGLTAETVDKGHSPDPCLGVIPDCESACCGHGRKPGWISRPKAGVRLEVVART